VEGDDEFGDVVAAWIVTSHDDLRVVLNATRVVALTFTVRDSGFVGDFEILSVGQGGDGKNDELK
jgi:hypothetical protein